MAPMGGNGEKCGAVPTGRHKRGGGSPVQSGGRRPGGCFGSELYRGLRVRPLAKRGRDWWRSTIKSAEGSLFHQALCCLRRHHGMETAKTLAVNLLGGQRGGEGRKNRMYFWTDRTAEILYRVGKDV